jgi:hypothetical protein
MQPPPDAPPITRRTRDRPKAPAITRRTSDRPEAPAITPRTSDRPEAPAITPRTSDRPEAPAITRRTRGRPAAGGLLEARPHRGGHVRLRRELQVGAELDEARPQRRHRSTPCSAVAPSSACSRPSARESRDLTVPLRQPSVAAVSASESSRK